MEATLGKDNNILLKLEEFWASEVWDRSRLTWIFKFITNLKKNILSYIQIYGVLYLFVSKLLE